MIQNIDDQIPREKWNNNYFFMMASLGALIGLENIFNFPLLMANAGGLQFLLPWIIGRIFVGFPLILMELKLGQFFIKGSFGCQEKINERLCGSALLSIFAGISISAFLAAIQGWVALYFVLSFSNPLSYSISNNQIQCVNQTTQQQFFSEILNLQQDCKNFTIDDIRQIEGYVYLATAVTWVIVYMILSRGIKSLKYAIGILLPLQFALFIVFLIRICILNDAVNGISYYLNGNLDQTINQQIIYENENLWSNGLFNNIQSLFVGLGIYTAFGSYTKQNSDLVNNSFYLISTNMIYSFLCGFIFWGVIGYLNSFNIKEVQQLSNITISDVAFTYFPQAFIQMDDSNIWSILFYLWLYISGITTLIAIQEGMITQVKDIMKPNEQHFYAYLVFLIIGLLTSIPFTTNIGKFYGDIIYHYVWNYLVTIIILMECISVGWVYDFDNQIQKVPKRAVISYAIIVWICVLVFSIITYFVFNQSYEQLKYIPFCATIVGIILGFFNTWLVAGKNFKTLWNYILLGNSKQFAQDISNSHNYQDSWSTQVFEFYIAISIKYIIPISICFYIWESFYRDINVMYNNYPFQYQWIGGAIVIVAIFFFLIPMFYYQSNKPQAQIILKENDDQNQDNKKLQQITQESAQDISSEIEEKNDIQIQNIIVKQKIQQEQQEDVDNLSNLSQKNSSEEQIQNNGEIDLLNGVNQQKQQIEDEISLDKNTDEFQDNQDKQHQSFLISQSIDQDKFEQIEQDLQKAQRKVKIWEQSSTLQSKTIQSQEQQIQDQYPIDQQNQFPIIQSQDQQKFFQQQPIIDIQDELHQQIYFSDQIQLNEEIENQELTSQQEENLEQQQSQQKLNESSIQQQFSDEQIQFQEQKQE